MTDATEELLRRSSKLLFYPQKGPQEDLLKFKGVPEVLFGGARGGGKTASLLGDFVSDVSVYKSHWIGMLFRRTYPELEEVIRQSFEFYPQTGASYNANEKCWKWPNGAKLYLRYMGHPRDAANYQGFQCCLALGEKVATSSGEKAIEDLKVGDIVMTGSGYHRVIGVTAPVDKPCVKVDKRDGTSQVHPVDHEILCDSGWQSYSSLVGISAKDFLELSLESDKLPSVDVLVRCVKRILLAKKLEAGTSTQSYEEGKFSELFQGSILTFLKQFVSTFLGRKQRRLHDLQKKDYEFSHPIFDEQVSAVSDLASLPNSQFGYRPYRHFYDALLPAEKETDLNAFLQLDGAEKPLRYDYIGGVQDNIQKYNQLPVSKYLHPYVGSELEMVWENSLEACSISYVGVKTCVDIHVEAVNNYITASTGILNKNCWLGWDELGNFATDEGYTQMIACLRSPHDVPHKRIRATANPGGVGHGWVKARFEIAEHPTGYKLIESETGMHRMFIPSRVTDNQILLRADPNYVQRLHDIGSPEMVRAWLHGDWDVVAGAYFPEFSQEHVIDSIEPDDLPQHWKIYRAYDHGTYHPFAVLWYTYAGEDWRGIKKGSIVILREWYGGNDKDEGLKLSLVDIRDGIVDREATIRRRVEPGPADNQIFENNGGQSIADALAIAGIYFSRSDKARIPGWNQIRMRLREHTLLFTRNCRHLLRTFPMLQHDDAKPEDIDTDGADHCFVGSTLVNTANGPMRIDEMPESGHVWTSAGLKPYENCGLKIQNAETVILTFNNGQKVQCTPDHKFLTTTGKWVQAIWLMNKVVETTHSTKYVCINIELGPKADVYCLHVPEVENFAIEGGIIVHNCADVVRYIGMQWPVIPRFDKKKKRGANAVTYNDLVEAVDDVSNRWRI